MAWTLTVIAGLSFATWLYLLGFRGGFWHADQRLEAEPGAPETWPAVVALVPARDEAEVIGAAVTALLAQDYPGPFQVVLIDDHSSDCTAALAERAAAAASAPGGALGRLRTVSAPDTCRRAGPASSGRFRRASPTPIPSRRTRPTSGSATPTSRTAPGACGPWSPRPSART